MDGIAITTQCPHNGTTVGDYRTNFQHWCGSDGASICRNSDQGELFSVPDGNVSGIARSTFAFELTSIASTIADGSTPSETETSSTASGPTPSETKATSSPTCSASNNRSRTTIGVGVGVAVPLTLLAVVLGTLFILERKKRVAAERGYANTQHVDSAEMNGSGGGYTQAYKYAPAELNSQQELHEMGHHNRSM